MAYSKRTWLQRIVAFPGRRQLGATGTTDVYDVSRAEGDIIQEGDAWTALNMNDFEDRIETGLDEKLDKTSVVANLSTTVPGSALDATMGTELAGDITDINNSFTWVSYTIQNLTNVSSATYVIKANKLNFIFSGIIAPSVTGWANIGKFPSDIILETGPGGDWWRAATNVDTTEKSGEVVVNSVNRDIMIHNLTVGDIHAFNICIPIKSN